MLKFQCMHRRKKISLVHLFFISNTHRKFWKFFPSLAFNILLKRLRCKIQVLLYSGYFMEIQDQDQTMFDFSECPSNKYFCFLFKHFYISFTLSFLQISTTCEYIPDSRASVLMLLMSSFGMFVGILGFLHSLRKL